ncbi:type II toxin-antitoxin system VapC family toxin [Roseococcus sp. YIM B11640]|uniref:type II toxin-antitoxin system VapC family toxin n=1 Tax=Roseococcus sp. YIM B11640 TaxID=3133973 RepID=UPI003C79B7B3
MADLRKVYVDSCCFIDLVRTDIGKSVTSEREHDVWYLKRLLEAHRDGEVLVFTSVLSVAECRHAGDNNISDEVKSQFNRLLCSGQYVRLVMMTPFIAQDARDLHWVHGILGIKGADSIHIASALDRKCEEFLSCDGRLERIGAQSGPLSRFGLYSKRPKDTSCLPAKYLQMELGNTKH